MLTPQVAVQEHRVELLKMENSFLNQKLASVEEKNVIKDGWSATPFLYHTETLLINEKKYVV